MDDDIGLELEGTPDPTAIRIDLVQVEKDILEGLPREQDRLRDARKNRIYFEGDNDSEVPARQAEDRQDFDQRAKQISFMTRKVIRGLTCHTYSPGPTRRLKDEAATAWLERVYQDVGANSLWHEADREATLQGVCAFQVAATGDPKRPIRIHLWTCEELAVWCPADDALNPQAVCTISQDGPDELYTLYTPYFVQRYKSDRSGWGMNKTSIRKDGPEVANPYGRLPFAWVHFERPTRKFWVKGLGSLVRKVNARADEKMSELAEAQRFYLKPIGLATGTPPGWRPKIRPGAFNSVPFKPGPNGEMSVKPEVWLLQATVDVAGAWLDITNTIETGLSDLDVPLAAYRAEQSSAKSGAAMVTEQAPLMNYAKGRRLYYQSGPEVDLIKLVCSIGATYYAWSEAGLAAGLAAEADDPQTDLAWPDDLRIPTMESSSVQSQDLENHLTSHIKILMLERNFSRAQAERELAEIVKDEALYQQLLAQAGLPPGPADRSQDDPATDEDDERGGPGPSGGTDPDGQVGDGEPTPTDGPAS